MSPREESMQRVRDIMGRGNLLAHGNDVRHILAAYDEAVAALAKVTAQRDELARVSEPVADALRDIAGDGHGAYLDAYQAVVDAIAAQPPAEKAEGGA